MDSIGNGPLLDIIIHQFYAFFYLLAGINFLAVKVFLAVYPSMGKDFASSFLPAFLSNSLCEIPFQAQHFLFYS